MDAFIAKVCLPQGWTQEDAACLPDCVVLRHPVYGLTTIDAKRRLYAPGFGTPNRATCTMTYRGRGWEQCIVNDATANNAGYWNAA